MISKGSVKNINQGSKIFGLTILIALLVYSLTTMFVPITNPKGNSPEFKYLSMNTCIDASCYEFGLTLLLSTVVFAAWYIFQRKMPMIGLGVIFVMSIAAIVVVSTVNKLDTEFEYIKLVSIIVGCIFLSLVRVVKWGNSWSNIWSWLLWFILAINIAEAVYSEFKNGHYINPCLGIILILFAPNPFNTGESWKKLLNIGGKDMIYKTSILWVLLYTTWNANYAYSERKEHFAAIIPVLLVPLLSTIPNSLAVNPHLYIQARTYTLFIRYMAIGYNTFTDGILENQEKKIFKKNQSITPSRDIYQKYSDSTGWYDDKAKEIWDYVNIALGSMFVMSKIV